MPTSRWIFFVAALLLAGIAPASATWSPLGSPIQPSITLQLDPGRPELLYARVFASEGPEEDYLWRSENGGMTWRNVQSGLENPVNALAIDPSNPKVIWAWTPDGQLWRSADAGDTWSRRLTTPTDQIPPHVQQLLVDPHHPDTLYRVDAENNLKTLVAVSRDGGASFTEGGPVSSRSFSFDAVYVHPERDELLAFDMTGLRVSTNGGQTWSLRGRYRGTGFVSGRLAPSDPDTLYGLTPTLNHCLARSDDAGAHWQSLATPTRLPVLSHCFDVAIDPRDARHVWLAVVDFQGGGRRNLLFESRDGGATWSRPFFAPTDGAAAAGGDVLYTGSIRGHGLYVSRDGGRSWKRSDQGILAGDLRDGLVAQRLPGGGVGRRIVALNTPLTGEADDLYRSDGGQSWLKIPLQPSTIADAGGSVVLAGGVNGVSRSRDGGNTWSVVSSAPPVVRGFRPNLTQASYTALVAYEDTVPYGNIVLWTSDDAGATWHRSSDGLPISCAHIVSVECPSFPAYAVDPFNPSRRWVAYNFLGNSDPPTIFTSQDGGASWQGATSSLPQALALAADPLVEGRILAGTDGGLFVSADGGRNWLPLGDLPDGAVVRQFVRDERAATWYAATTARGIYRSLDNGAHWTLLAGAPDHDNPTIAVDPRRPTALLAAFRGQGVWRWTP